MQLGTGFLWGVWFLEKHVSNLFFMLGLVIQSIFSQSSLDMPLPIKECVRAGQCQKLPHSDRFYEFILTVKVIQYGSIIDEVRIIRPPPNPVSTEFLARVEQCMLEL